MKKITALLLATVLVCAALTSCGAKTPYNYDLTKYMTVADYKTVELDKSKVADDIQAEIDSVLNRYSEEKERDGASQEGDVITYNVNASVDGEANEDLTADGATYTVGTTKTDFEEVNTVLSSGLKKDDVRDVTVTVPEDYSKEELRGKTVEFTIKVVGIKYTYTPEELSDAMVSESTGERYTTVADFKAYLETTVPQGLAFEAVMENTKYTSYPEKEAEKYYDSYVMNYQNTATQYGMTLEQLASMYGGASVFYKSLADQAVKAVNREMLIYYIYRTENLKVTEEIEADVIADLLASYEYETEKELRKAIPAEAIEASCVYEAVLAYLGGNIKYVEAPETEAAE